MRIDAHCALVFNRYQIFDSSLLRDTLFQSKLYTYKLNMASEVEEIMKRMQNQKGVVGTMVVNSEGTPVKSSMDNATTLQYAGLVSQLSAKARSVVRDLDPSDELTFLRVRSKKHEILVAPDKDFLLLVVQNPTD